MLWEITYKNGMSLRTERFSSHECLSIWAHISKTQPRIFHLIPTPGGEVTCALCTNLPIEAKCVPLNLHMLKDVAISFLLPLGRTPYHTHPRQRDHEKEEHKHLPLEVLCCSDSSEEPTPPTVSVVECTLSVRNFALLLWHLARYWSYNWASLAAKTCSRLKQGWWVKINPEMSMSSWKFPGESPDPIMCGLLCTYLTACQREQSVGGKQLRLI